MIDTAGKTGGHTHGKKAGDDGHTEGGTGGHTHGKKAGGRRVH